MDQTEESKEQKPENLALQEKVLQKIEGFFDEYYLGSLQRAGALKFIQSNIANKENKEVERLRNWIFLKLNKQKYTQGPVMQQGCPDIIPGLRAQPWWNTEEFPWIEKIRENFQVIKDEVLALRKEKGFQPYRGPTWTSKIPADDGIGHLSHDKGQWNVFYLYLHEIKFLENCKKVPKTIEIIDKYFPRQYFHAFISAVNPGTHIMKHYGPTNKKLRFHLPLVGVKGSRLRAGDITKEQEEGVPYVFDDSFDHEAWHDGDETRIILIVDIWHPDLTDAEVKFLNVLQRSQMRFEKHISEQDPEKDNFYSIIEQARDIIQDNDWWVQK